MDISELKVELDKMVIVGTMTYLATENPRELSKSAEEVLPAMVKANLSCNPALFHLLDWLNDYIMEGEIGHEYVSFFLNTLREKYGLTEVELDLIKGD